jgi:dipeptidyl aminopeptidase/acylaminoacyl peptidase
MTKEATSQRVRASGKKRGSAFLVLALGAMLAASAAVAGTAPEAQAAFNQKIVFVSDRTTGVDNPTGDDEILTMNTDGTGARQLTFNDVDDAEPTLSPDGRKIAYMSSGGQTSNPQGDLEIYVMKAADGTGTKNLTHNGDGVDDYSPVFRPTAPGLPTAARASNLLTPGRI